MRLLRWMDKTLTKIEETVLAFGVIFMSLILIVNVIGRYIFNYSFGFTEEIGQMSLVCITFLGLSYVTRINRHIKMTVLIDNVSDKAKKALTIIINSITSLCMLYMVYISLKYSMSVYASGRVTINLGMPVFYITLLLPLGFLMTAIRFIQVVILNITYKELYMGTELSNEGETNTALCSMEKSAG